MRDIKFRAKDDDGKWIDFSLEQLLSEDGSSWYQFIHKPYRQYTGLKDKNGKEIYEGDIVVVRTLHDGDEMCWNQMAFNLGKDGAIPQVVSWDEQLQRFDFGGCSRILYSPYDFEVIGNIYDNPELLKIGG